MVGIAITCCLAVGGFMKWLRNDRMIAVLLILTGMLAVIGVVYRVPENPRLNTWDGLLGPLAYVASYALLRQAYRSIFQREPTYAYLTWYDWEERRRMNWFDLGVHILPMLIGMAVPAIVTRVLG
ncbi:MAG: hypothetical protein IT229_10325 [Flavobacteriales bacterium]|nr:hypothetical protein [Flavobacteriales bacterium]